MNRKTLGALMGLFGLGFLSLAVFAQTLGVARSAGWGPGRRIVAATGVVLLILSALFATWPLWKGLGQRLRGNFRNIIQVIAEIPVIKRVGEWSQDQMARWQSAWNGSAFKKFLVRLGSTAPVRYCTRTENRKAASASVIVGTLVILAYIWYVSVGFWTYWPKTTDYYQQLSDGFAHGQVSLLTRPAPALLNLSDPYTLANRGNIPYPWDAVLYGGHFYLYWGPVPALVILATRLITQAEIGDNHLVFFFATGTFLVSAFFILRIRARFFPRLHWTFVVPGILLAGLANPMPWLLNRPAVYEAAIASGQFFLLTGLFLGFLAFDKDQYVHRKLLLSGLCLALAVASRASLAFASVFLAFLISAYILWMFKAHSKKISVLVAFLLPFLGGVVAMGWYNKIRFGNWLEFGFKYQLTGMNTHINTFSLANMLINLHNYLINPLRLLSTFPYVKPRLGGHFIFFPIISPANYYSEDVNGILITVPYILLSLIPVVYLTWYAWKYLIGTYRKMPFTDDQRGDGFFRWTIVSVAGAAFLAFVPILLYIAGMMRFLADVIPLLVILSTLGLFMGRQLLNGKGGWILWFNLLVVFLTLYSVVVSLLLAVTGAEARFEHLNPILFDVLTRFFTP